MKLFFQAIIVCLVLAGCNNKAPKNETTIADSTLTNVINNNEIKETETTDTLITVPADSLKKDTKENEPESLADKMLKGKHNITLHWIGWNIPGAAVIEKTDTELYTIKGRHESKTGYLIVDGKLKPASDNPEDKILKLDFDGLIEYKEATINNNKPCIKKGKQVFLSTQGRKYWRLQNMLNCDGITTDYVDIYF